MSQCNYKRVLLKLSGESLAAKSGASVACNIDPDMLRFLAGEIKQVHDLGVEIAIVVGGGNIFRGAMLADSGTDRITGDSIGMLATVINALALQDAVREIGVEARVMSAISIGGVCEDYIRAKAIDALRNRCVVILAAGTGSPLFTTDTAASLRASEVRAELVLKATKVDGVYDKDPVQHPGAKMYSELSFVRLIIDRLGIMDSTAAVMCRDNGIPVRVFKISDKGAFRAVITGKSIGTLIHDQRP